MDVSAGVVGAIEIAFSRTSLPSAASLMNSHCWECIETLTVLQSRRASSVTAKAPADKNETKPTID